MIFDTFETVLVELDSSGNDQHGAGWESLVEGSLIDLAGYYGNQNLRNPNRDLVNYSGLATQAAYIYMYAIGRAEFTYQLLKKFRQNQGKPLFNSGNLNVTSIGGGPVSELVGLIKYLETPDFGEGVNKIVYDVLDKESDWEDVAHLVVDAIPTKVDISLNFWAPRTMAISS